MTTLEALDLLVPHSHRPPDFDLAEVHVPRMLRVARSILGSDDLAWDAVQEALLCLWHEPEAPRDLRGWLVRTTVHRSLQHARSSRRRDTREDLAARDRAGGAELDPSAIASGRELARLIEIAIDALPIAFGTAFRAYEIEGLDYEQIAQRTRVPVGTVRSRIFRAKRRLRANLAALVHDQAWCRWCTEQGAQRSAPAGRG